MAVPQWVQDRLVANPNEEVWQICFREHETKAGRPIRIILPRTLIPLLEEYIQCYRPALLNGTDPGTLFVTAKGQALPQNQVTALIGKLTRKHAGRRVTPHLFRDIFALYWLKNYPAEIATVSKALWHNSIEVTARKYAWAFDASHALTRIEEHFEKGRAD